MLRTYIYNEIKNIWIEESQHLLLHDLCAILDEDKKMMYIWNGPKSSEDRLEKGYGALEELIMNSPDPTIQLTILEEAVPDKIQEKLDILLETVRKAEAEEITRFSRLASIRLYYILLIIGIILPIISILNLALSLTWPLSGANTKVSADTYDLWLFLSAVLITITLIIFIINTVIGIVEKDIQVIIFSSVAFIVCIGILLYLNQGIYLFLFRGDSSSETYYISQIDLVFFLLINLLPIAILEIPNVYKLLDFHKTYRDYIR